MPDKAQPGLLAPLANRTYASLWVANVVSSVGTAMQTVGATWLLVQSGASAGLVATLLAAGSVPLFLAGLPAGVLADIVDRRLLLIAANAWMAVAAAILAIATWSGSATPVVLIGATFAIGLGAAFAAPAFQAIVPEIAPGNLLAPGVALNSVGVNIARTIGPALGGIAVASIGAPSTFAVNAGSTLAVVAALVAWRRAPDDRRLPPEHFASATRASLRYVRHAPGVRRLLAQAGIYFFFASAPWAMLPLVASGRLHLGADGYGLLLGGLGAGAVGGALVLGRLMRRIGAGRVLLLGSALSGTAGAGLAFTDSEISALAIVAAFGGGWIATLTVLNVGIQGAVAGWIRARMLSLYVVVYFGSFAFGTMAWGRVADGVGIETTLVVAGLAGLASTAGLAAIGRKAGPAPNLAPAATAEPTLLLDPDGDHGAVLVSTDYSVTPERSDAFAEALAELRESRLRTGAFAWRHWTDGADPKRHIESYVVESWTEHLRQTLRRTVSDEALEARVTALVEGRSEVRLLREKRVGSTQSGTK